MMLAKICSGVAIAWANCSSAEACTIAVGTGRVPTGNWIDTLEWAQPAERVVVDDYLLAIDHTEARLIELDARLIEIAQADPYREPVGWLRYFRGIETLTGILCMANCKVWS